ncbi:MAG: phosphatase PAP2 family protein [Pseudomonadales bacterium]|nr:phosphatase PAP2 family protein [Pseudomonadales bacterium]
MAWSFADQFDQSSYVVLQQDLFIEFNHYLAVLPHSLWLNMTYMGDGLVIFALFSFMLIIRAQAWAAMFASILIASVVTNVGKAYFLMPRPAVVLDNDSFFIVGDVLIGFSSFPSGHSITISFVFISMLATLFACPETIKEKIFLLLGLFILVLFCISRVAVGAHWPLDIIAGAGLGWLAALIGVSIARNYTTWWQCMLCGKRRFILAGLLMILSIILIVRVFDEFNVAPILILAAAVSLYVAFVLIKFPATLTEKYAKTE